MGLLVLGGIFCGKERRINKRQITNSKGQITKGKKGDGVRSSAMYWR